MSNKLLKKIVSDRISFPKEELNNLIKAELQESDILKAILDSLDEGHIIVDSRWVIRYYNRAVLSLIPLSRASKLEEGRKLEGILGDKDISLFVHDVINGKEKPEPKDFTIGVGNENRTIRIEFERLVVNDEIYVDVIIRDISDTIRKETRLRRSESLASMTTMAAGIAHEIKNPLAAMKIHIQLMQKYLSKRGSIDQESAETYLNVLEEELDHLNSIAVDFLFAVKPMNAELRLASINVIIKDLLCFLAPEADEKNIKIISDLDPFIPRLELDQKYVRQAFLNLVQNAFAAMQSGGTLTVKTKHRGDVISVMISDDGSGIEESKLQKIFEPYFTTKATGTGLGLTTVYKIMKEHNGDIHVRSQVGVGTTFTLDFPVPVSQRIALEENI